MDRHVALEWLKHAFAVESPNDLCPTDTQAALVDGVARQIVARQMTTPALMLLEMSRPLNFAGAQVLHFLHPFVSAMTDDRGYAAFTNLLEQRGSIDYLCERIEAAENEHRDRQSVRRHSGSDLEPAASAMNNVETTIDTTNRP